MTKRHVVETVEEYDGDGKMTKKTTTETTEEEENPTNWTHYSIPYVPGKPWWEINLPENAGMPTVTC